MTPPTLPDPPHTAGFLMQGNQVKNVPYTCGRCGQEFWNPHRPYALNALMRHQTKCKRKEE